MSEAKPHNYCVSCGVDFASIKAFDKHRVGVHEYLFSEGLRMDPPRENGRRCLDESELPAAGMERDEHGCWRLAANAEHARRRFQKPEEKA